jgi:N6-adenosine-specific RNA methylase IME4
MSLKPSTKLMISILGVVLLLFLSAPTIFSYGWQLVHGREVTLGGLGFRLDPGWIILHGSAARLPEDIFVHSSEETFISATQIKACQTDQSASAILLRLHGDMTKAEFFAIDLRDDPDGWEACVLLHRRAWRCNPRN